jgi:hypothetical protein
MKAEIERDKALSILGKDLVHLSKLFKECNLEQGRGALLLHTRLILEPTVPNKSDYRTKEEIVDLFEDKKSRSEIAIMVDEYESKKSGILVLITSQSNATFYITVKLS